MIPRTNFAVRQALRVFRRNALLALGQPGLMAWITAGAILLATGLLPSSERGRLFISPAVATAVLLLATARAWRSQRRPAEFILLGGLLTLTALGVTRMPEVLQLGFTAIIMVLASLIVLSWVEWRFAPDFGQEGRYWAIEGGAYSALWSGLGLALAMIACAALKQYTGIGASLLYACGAIVGRAFGCFVAPPYYAYIDPATHVLHPEKGDADDETIGDWWKKGESR